MKLAYKLSIGGVLLIAVLIGASLLLWSSLDKIIEGAIEQYGSEVTQTPVEVSGVKIGLTSGEGSISGLSIGNPKGFADPNIFTLGNIATQIDTKTVTEKTIVINSIQVSAPRVFYEIDKTGASNVDALKKNIAAATGGGKSSEGEGEAPKLIINRLVIDKGEVSARVAALGGKPLSASLPQIVLTDIGKNSGGATPSEVSEKVVNALMDKSRSAVTGLGLDKYLGKSLDEVKQLGTKLQDTLKDGTGGGVEDTLQKGGDAIKGLFGQ